MTIVEIAKTHKGRRFRRKSWQPEFHMQLGNTIEPSCFWLQTEDLAADDWEFEPMSREEALAVVKQAAEMYRNVVMIEGPSMRALDEALKAMAPFNVGESKP